MKRSVLLVILLVALAACGIAVYAVADNQTTPTIIYDGSKGNSGFGDFVDAELKDVISIEKMVPGQTETFTFNLEMKNFRRANANSITIKMGSENWTSNTENPPDPLDKFSVSVNGGEPKAVSGTTTESVIVKTFTGDTEEPVPVEVKVTLDVSAGNDYQDLDISPKLVFTAEADRKPTPTPSGGGGSTKILNTADHFAYIVGYGDGTVKPNASITRAEVAAIFFRMLTDSARNQYWMETNGYSDVTSKNWFNNPVSTLSNIGIIKGYEDGTFRPNGQITRAEFATIVARFFEVTYNGGDKFTDIANHWAKDYINQAAEKGIVKGYEDNTFRPNQAITRAEAMALINRVLERNPSTVSDLLPTCAQWTDNQDTAKWYYIDVEEATTSHNYERKTDKTEKWRELREDPNWTQYEKTK